MDMRTWEPCPRCGNLTLWIMGVWVAVPDDLRRRWTVQKRPQAEGPILYCETRPGCGLWLQGVWDGDVAVFDTASIQPIQAPEEGEVDP